ncbi:hypothetical protein P175DRAFT_0557369 [Aspergillus ochraceoroseus IBT 24754]|uniref:peptidylprolyl isomerase n=2 Tax=Aspergillus subgen. Nidulantes TaxID=2720870 RepID=A0A0F8WM17_9EURO|nr:uncharacterized protein P175DRAFT_0557369 [Aspergillus ochraceoroseus IBT 24754]KKK12347.1 hypothetical protein ARAM_005706 [Aspergillus rambellii]PTU20684.1 hypothetical protein P175DRAFT_0557369 [Aspergillus ochraceoroseus IBT 24754]
MSAVQPVAVYALRVPAGGVLIPAVPNAAAMFRISMAAIDPDEEPEFGEDATQRPRATLKIVRPPPGLDMDEDSDDDYEDDDEEDDSEDDEEVNGGPSDKEKARKLKALAALKEMEDAMEDDDSDDGEEFDLKAAISKLVKGKAPAFDDDEEDDEAESDEEPELDEMVICTLDPERNCQQPLDITVSENERVFFMATGTHTIYLTGNYVMPLDDGHHHHDDEEDEDEYDLSPDEDELDLDELMGEDDESDDLDDLENPRITEVDSEEEAPKLVDTKQKKKRAAEADESLEDLIANDSKAKAVASGESKKQQKKLKKNNGEAAPVESKSEAKEAKEAKKVQFAKNLEQGPTPSKEKKPAEKAEKTDKATGTLGVKEVKGVTIDDKKLGKGPAATAGNTVAMRYIGKLENGKVFDSNKKGKPFTFKLGKGEVIKGWDIGVAGMAVGSERRITIPPHLAYGKKALPGIPANSKLIFDVKLNTSVPGPSTTRAIVSSMKVLGEDKKSGRKPEYSSSLNDSSFQPSVNVSAGSEGSVSAISREQGIRSYTQASKAANPPSHAGIPYPDVLHPPVAEQSSAVRGSLEPICLDQLETIPRNREQKQLGPQTTDEGVASLGSVDFRRSQSTPVELARLVSLKLSTTFGSATVIRRSHLNLRPNICTAHPQPSNALPVVDLGENSDSSMSQSSKEFPEDSTSTPPTSEGQSGFPMSSDRDGKGGQIAMGEPHLFQSNHSEGTLGLGMESPAPLPSILTVEAAANAKVFFETYFNTLYSGVDGRTQRRYELDQYIISLPLTPEEKIRVKKQWMAQEREYLRQCRVLKSRSHSSPHQETPSLAGFEVIKVLGRGSFGVVRLVREKSVENDQCKADKGELPSFTTMLESAERKTPTGGESESVRSVSPSNHRQTMTGVKKNVFAMKVIRKSVMIRNSQEGHLRAERDFLVASAKSRWIVPLIASFQDNNFLYLVMDYMVGGDFLGLLMRRNMLPEDISRWYVAEMILCIEEAHRLRWIHRDVKPDNFLISASGHLKISDFGLAFDGHWTHDQWYYTYQRHSLVQRLGIQVEGDAEDREEARKATEESTPNIVQEGSLDAEWIHPPASGLLNWRDRNQKRRLARSVVGTSQYMAPEVIRGQPYDGRCDWWSVGIILYECLYGFTPFASEDRHKTKAKINHHLQTLYFPVHRPSDKVVSSEAVDLINYLLQEKEFRLSSVKYKTNDALLSRSARNFFNRPDPSNRNYQGLYVYPDDASDIKAHPFFRGINWEEIHRTCPPFIPKVKNWEDTRYFDDGGYPSDPDDISTDSEGGHPEVGKVSGDDKGGHYAEQDEGKRNNPVFDRNIAPNNDAKDVANSSAKGKKKKRHNEPRRPRDKILRDKRLRKTVVDIRKKGAFLGYTYRRPKGVILALGPERGRPFISRGQLSELYG